MNPEDTVLPPTRAIAEAADEMYRAVGFAVGLIQNIKDARTYESTSETRALFILLLRHIESLCLLAKRDLVLLPTAYVITRSVFEGAVKILWMLAPEDVMAREANWLAHLGGEVDYHARMARFLKSVGHDGEDFEAAAESIKQFRSGVEALLPEAIERVSNVPDFRALLRSLNQEQLYFYYIKLSQFAHSSSVGSGLYKKNLGTAKEFGEFVSPELWQLPLTICWYCLHHAAASIARRHNVDLNSHLTPGFVQNIGTILNRI